MAGEVLIGYDYLSAETTDIFIRKPVFSTNTYKFRATDDKGNLLFEIRGTSTRLHKQRAVVDSSGKTILTLRMKWRTMHQRWKVFRGASTKDKDLIFTTKKSSVKEYLEDIDLEVCLGYSDRVSYKVNSSCQIYKANAEYIIYKVNSSCQIYKANAEYIMAKLNPDTVKVYPNVDMAFTVSLIAILDAMIVQKEQGQTAELVILNKVYPAARFILPHSWFMPSVNFPLILKMAKAAKRL